MFIVRSIVFLALASVTPLLLTAAEQVRSVSTNGTEVVVEVSGYADGLRLESAYDETFTKLIKRGTSVLEYFPSTACAYKELVIENGQIRVKRSDALGTGPITLANYTSLMIPSADVTISNKVTFGIDSSVASLGDNSRITLQSVASSRSAGNRVILLGRSGGGSSSARLQLTEDSNELDGISMRGKLDLELDDCTLKIARTARQPFFNNLDPEVEKSVTVGPNGLTVDVASGITSGLGIAPVFRSCLITNVLEACEPNDYGFEILDSGEWTILTSDLARERQEYSGIKSNGSAFDTDASKGLNFATPDGSKYMMLRRTTGLSRDVTIPTNGLWRLTYLCGSRPSGNYGLGISTEIYIDGQLVHTDPAITSSADLHPFRRVETAALTLSAGTHTIRLQLSDSPNTAGSQNYDRFVFERLGTVPRCEGLTKRGDGKLALENGCINHPIKLEAGELSASDLIVGTDVNVSVAPSAKLTLTSPKLERGACIDVKAGGMLELVGKEESLIMNGSFELDEIEDFKGGSPSGWTRSLTDSSGTYNNLGGAGYQHNGGTLSANGPLTPAGSQSAYLRNYTKLTQSVTVHEAGIYRLTFLLSARSGYDSNSLRLAAMIDGEEVIAVGPWSSATDGFRQYTIDLTLAQGTHELAFSVTGDATLVGNMVFLDDVNLNRLRETTDITQGEIRMEAGATLRLDNSNRFHIYRFLVNGKPVDGNAKTLASLGINIQGTGTVRIGPPGKFTIIIR